MDDADDDVDGVDTVVVVVVVVVLALALEDELAADVDRLLSIVLEVNKDYPPFFIVSFTY